MRFVTSIYTNEQLNHLSDVLDCALLQVPHLSLNYRDLRVDEAIKTCVSDGIMPILSLDRIYQPSDIGMAKSFLEDYKDQPVWFYVTDLGVANYALRLGIGDRVIFDPKTMITNSLDLGIYASYGFHALGISSEITMEDALKIQKKENRNVFYLIFGYRLMFYSKRHLISLYSEKNGEEYPKTDVLFREATRKDYFPGFENENGTAMYRSYPLSMLPYMEELSPMAYGYLESYRMEDDLMHKVLEVFSSVRDKKMDKEEGIRILSSLGLDTQDGFAFKDSVYQKEELKI